MPTHDDKNKEIAIAKIYTVLMIHPVIVIKIDKLASTK